MNRSWRHLCKTSWRCLEDVLKTFLQYVLKTSSRGLEDIVARRLKYVLKRFWRCLGKTSWRRLEDVWSRRIYWSWSRRLGDVLKTSSRCLQKVFIKTNVCWVSCFNFERKSIFYFIYGNLCNILKILSNICYRI